MIDSRGRNIPFFVESFIYQNISSANFDPITLKLDTPHGGTALTDQQISVYSGRGFLVRPDVDGLFYGITYADYVRNHKSLTGLVPQGFLALANTWIECPFVKIYGHTDGTYASAASYCNIAPL